MAEPQHLTGDAAARAVDELNRLCSAIPDCDGVAKLRGKLYRIECAVNDYQRTGNAAAFRESLPRALEMARSLLTVDPLAQFLDRLSALDEACSGAVVPRRRQAVHKDRRQSL